MLFTIHVYEYAFTFFDDRYHNVFTTSCQKMLAVIRVWRFFWFFFHPLLEVDDTRLPIERNHLELWSVGQ